MSVFGEHYFNKYSQSYYLINKNNNEKIYLGEFLDFDINLLFDNYKLNILKSKLNNCQNYDCQNFKCKCLNNVDTKLNEINQFIKNFNKDDFYISIEE